MSKTIKIKKGYDLKLQGSATAQMGKTIKAKTYALKPSDFKEITPRLLLREGAEVKAGDAIFIDKDRPDIHFCSPVSGIITEIKRGAKRRILEIIIRADEQISYKDFGKANVAALSADDVKAKLLDSGAWALLIERPFGVVAGPKHQPKNIFITGISSAPLAADVNMQVKDLGAEMQAGLDALLKLTEGKVYLSLDGDNEPCDALKNLKGAETVYFSGPHPKGNIGVQMHHIAPINKGETAWSVTAEDLAIIGRIFTEGKFNVERTISVGGTCVKSAEYVKMIAGANVAELVALYVNDGNNRYISGNILTGDKIEKDGFLGFYAHSFNVIPEGGEEEFLGWVLPGFGKFSLSRTFFSWLTPNKKFNLDANMHGEERAFVVTGQYEKVFPFDIYPVQLIKSIMIRDIEKMEQLGIYEVTEEDFALCEVICASKLPLQEIVRDGLSFLRQEVG